MPRQQIKTSKLADLGPHYSQAVAVPSRGVMVFISLMTRVADGKIAGIGDVEEQTRQVCENIRSAIEAAGGTIADICRVDVYLRNRRQRPCRVAKCAVLSCRRRRPPWLRSATSRRGSSWSR